MIVGDQSETIRFLESAPASGGAEVRTVPTHASLVFLSGERAFKLKRAVRYPYLDFSTPERRLESCRVELNLNRRTAPSLYLRVRTINRREDGSLAFDGAGPLVDAVVEMRRFAEADLFDTMARNGSLTPRLMTDLARQIARFHGSAAVSRRHGGVAGIAAVLDINDRALRSTTLVDAKTAAAFADRFRTELDRHSELLERRRGSGKVRRCHGDLILRNICLLDGVPTLFDCLEFNEDLATIDVLYDLAFLLMDLWHRNRRELANVVFNRYLDESDETDGLPLVPFFMAIRAAVRAHVTATQAMSGDGEEAGPLLAEAREYFDLALALLEPAGPALIAVGGFSGSGKSTIASLVAPEIGPAPGARTLNSDRIRKHMHGVSAEERLPESAYAPDISAKVYESLRKEAAAILDLGHAVIADAVFDRPDEREAIEQVARPAGVPFRGVWLEAPLSALLPRLAARRNDPSDATAEVLAAQMQRECGDIGWQRIDAAGDPQQARRAILALLSST